MTTPTPDALAGWKIADGCDHAGFTRDGKEPAACPSCVALALTEQAREIERLRAVLAHLYQDHLDEKHPKMHKDLRCACDPWCRAATQGGTG